jgi:Uma2 family endonuclease
MTTKAQKLAPLPDPPEGKPEDMTNFNQTNITGNAHNLMHHLGNFETTLVAGEHYMARTRPREMTGVRYPDLLVAFGVNPEAYRQSNAYIIDEQGKPPDFVMEIASPSTRDQDATVKRREYEALGIPEYWRFDEKGDSHRAKLAGDRLVDGKYVPIPIDEPRPGTLQGYSQALGLLIRWNEGQLQWIDPSTEDRIPSLQTEREGRLAEQEGRLAAERGRDAEREARLATEAQLRELQAELELRNNNP